MHEHSLTANLIAKMIFTAREQGARSVQGAKIKVGALCPVSATHLREHLEHAARGTPAEGARLHIEIGTDINDSHAQEVLLKSVELGR